MNLLMKPAWLDKKISLKTCYDLKQVLRGFNVETVCEQAMCPNMAECFSLNEATFLILGKHCTRMCSFCNIDKTKHNALDLEEPLRVACAVEKLKLKHVVITSVTRDDLLDGGADIFRNTFLEVRKKAPHVKIELLIPDFNLSLGSLKKVVSVSPDILAHNVETVPSLYNIVRQGALYKRSLEVLSTIKTIAPFLKTKSCLMLGLGEKEIGRAHV